MASVKVPAKYLIKVDEDKFLRIDVSGDNLERMGFTLTRVQRDDMMKVDHGARVLIRPGWEKSMEKILDRQNYVDALLVQSRGTENYTTEPTGAEDESLEEDECDPCYGTAKPEAWKKNSQGNQSWTKPLGPFLACTSWKGYLNSACGNCIWLGNKLLCQHNTENIAAEKAKAEAEQKKRAQSSDRAARAANRG
ncbi:unnamed protein product [Zymoseptoria tritici ST99CH_1E4]|uniref:Uncharacterized protein n=1 Tax=Zymoseptoria tritici ST99CH_1E4 TaxID=1276532 RepID=A0A2H1GZN8_ZYMTR|nr:unnamed protein product [Zymoseptoria tritici ST99CH_1E4]SMR55078.1 unnamed protein product [Zymoseptoria tritici ST99CH_1E4]SMR56699.1 unnamed protein product [Zymoseptoria tritici ST99CH_1E4]SMR58983.1 unnamed protein product [Zymoseptoria tritici ST99CH_1E4]SMR62046.1 unnamed protein product [Zymoseptoria tritici ST99CH_1E4]